MDSVTLQMLLFLPLLLILFQMASFVESTGGADNREGKKNIGREPSGASNPVRIGASETEGTERTEGSSATSSQVHQQQQHHHHQPEFSGRATQLLPGQEQLIMRHLMLQRQERLRHGLPWQRPLDPLRRVHPEQQPHPLPREPAEMQPAEATSMSTKSVVNDDQAAAATSADTIPSSSKSSGEQQSSHVVIKPIPQYTSSRRSSVTAPMEQQQPGQQTSKTSKASSTSEACHSGAEHADKQQQGQHQIHRPLPIKKRAFSVFQRSHSDVGPHGGQRPSGQNLPSSKLSSLLSSSSMSASEATSRKHLPLNRPHPDHPLPQLRLDMEQIYRHIPIYREGLGWQTRSSATMAAATGQAAGLIGTQKTSSVSSSSASAPSSSSSSSSSANQSMTTSKHLGKSNTFPASRQLQNFFPPASGSTSSSNLVENLGENSPPSTPREQQQQQQLQKEAHHQQRNVPAVDLSSLSRQSPQSEMTDDMNLNLTLLSPSSAAFKHMKEQESSSRIGGGGGANNRLKQNMENEHEEDDDAGDDERDDNNEKENN